jgi:hypothetical protein
LTPQHFTPLRLAAAVVALNICLVVLANVGCAGFLRRPENLFALGVLIAAALVLFLLSRTRGPAAKAASLFATRALPASPRWAVPGLVIFAVSTLAGNVILKVAASLGVPELVRC